MYFEATEDQAALRKAVREFARAELAPGYLARAQSDAFPWELHRRVAALGTFGLLAGPEHNPMPTEDFVAVGLAVEELGYADFNLANAAIPVLLMSSLIARHARPEVRERWLRPLVAGDCYLALGLTEPGTGSDVTAIRTTAVRDGDGYLLSGEKTSVTMLAHAEAIVVVARTVRDGAPAGASAFLVPLDAPGLHRSAIADTGWRPMGRGILHLDRVRVPESALVGAEGGAFRGVLNGFDFTRPLLALTGIGCAQASIDETAEYLRRRPAFGAPLARFEGASFPLAEHATHLEAARLLCYSALWHRTMDKPHTALAAMTKWYGPHRASRAIHDCLLLHGNYGYSTELPFEQRMRDVLAVEIADGTAQIQ
ncbi:MAG TPA: acyl-CoA dehydrogenase, partial [Pseudonocardia sp.]